VEERISETEYGITGGKVLKVGDDAKKIRNMKRSDRKK